MVYYIVYSVCFILCINEHSISTLLFIFIYFFKCICEKRLQQRTLVTTSLPKERQTCTVKKLKEFKETENPTFAYLDDSHDYDETQGQKLASSEDVLDTCGPAHTVAVHPCQQHYSMARMTKKVKMISMLCEEYFGYIPLTYDVCQFKKIISK